MIVAISKDSMYPIYSLGEWPQGIDVPDELFERYNKNMEEFDAIQDEIALIYEGALHSARPAQP